MQKKQRILLTLAYAQLAFSALLAITIIYGCLEFRTSLGQFSKSLAATIVSTANVIGQTADTIQTKQALFGEALATLVSTRKVIEQLKVSARNQTINAPKYAEGLRAASEYFSGAGSAFSKVADSLMIPMPTSIQLEGIKPVLVMTKPFKKAGQSLKVDAQNLNSLGGSLQAISSSLANDSKNLSAAIIETSNNAISLLNETEKTLTSLKIQNLPQAVAELRSTSANLLSASRQVNLAGNLGLVMLVAGLLLSGWCFLNSISVLYLTRNQSI